ncbi:serine/arginine repetitive matrix protein 5 [Drosophila santomea]|uniref:serine/arginine repetitive matrix protein 5 n=1 Tax=Drosophila santomea TaxID=129105 RepID=UPI001954D27C|nr:serine/arginine repetitive matrix protein 5 [Drosophila santomea]XP_039499168.1 serine/arginine repetitive matrix protein 5 [Drosophila santomea]
MSTEMSKFLGGGRRTPANRNLALKSRTGTGVGTPKGGTAAAMQPPSQRKQGPSNDTAGASRLGGGTGAAQPAPKSSTRPSNGAAGAVPKKPASRATPANAVTADAAKPVPKRATGGGVATRVMQTTATSTLRRRPAPPAAARMPISRRVNEVKWIMKPSQSFTPCSKSSSEDHFPPLASGSQERKADHAADLEQRCRCSSSSSSSSGGGGHLHRSQLLMPLPAEQIGRTTRSKGRASRIFRVPSQRIMHVDALMQAQLRQMNPRRIRNQTSRSPNWSASRSIPSPLSQQSSFRLPSSSPSSSTEVVALKEVVPLRDATTINPIPDLVKTLQPPISCSPSPDVASSPVPSRSRLQSPAMSTSSNSSSCTTENVVVSSTSSTSSRHSNTTTSNTSVIECRNGISTRTAEQLSPAVQGAMGSKAIKLTSTVIKIMQPVSSKRDVKTPENQNPKDREQEKEKEKKLEKEQEMEQEKKQEKEQVQEKKQGKEQERKQEKEQEKKLEKEKEQNKLPVQKGNAKTRMAMNAPMVQSISPPKFTPMVKVPNPISQSVNHVVNQLTAQLKEAAMMHRSKDDLPKDSNTYEAFSAKDPSRKPSIYLLMNQPRNQSGASTSEPFKDSWVIQPMEQPKLSTIKLHKDEAVKQHPNRYLDESIEHPRQYINQRKVRAASQQGNESKSPARNLHMMMMSPPKESTVQHPMSQYVTPPKARRDRPMRSPSKSSLLLRSRESKTGITRNPYIEETKTLSRLPAGARRTPPVSVNRISQPSTSTGSPKVVPHPEAPKPEATTVGKIIRKEQHKVPRTMEDGIDMSYQYFVSIPLKRGRKPQVVRYLYRPMVRQLNAPPSPSRRSRRASRRAAAAAAAAAAARDEDQPKAAEAAGSQKMDPELQALGGMPLPLEDAPSQSTEPSPQPAVKSKILLDPEAALNAPYEVPPLKLNARYKAMMEQLAQMPYPEDKSTRHRRRRSNRQVRAAGGADQEPSTFQDPGFGGGDGAKSEMSALQQVSSIWKSGSRLPKPVNYQPEANRLSTATGAPISYHSPVQFEHSMSDSEHFILPDGGPLMIQAITYDDIEKREQRLLDEKQDHPSQERKEGNKSVSFHPGKVEVSEFPVSSSSISISSSSSSSCGVSKTKTRRTSKKRKSKSKGRGKVRK